MKKTLLTFAVVLSVFVYQAFGQTISVSGVDSTIGSASGSFLDIQLTLTINGTNSIGDVESVNMLLKTFAAGLGLNGAGSFEITSITPTSPFSNTNATAGSFPIAFNTAGDTANSGSTISDPSKDTGSSAPAGSNPVAGTGTTTIPFETVRFTSLATLTPGSVYNFSVTAGGVDDPGFQGSWIDNMNGDTFNVNGEPTFTITVAAVPEPSTWLAGIGAVGVVGCTILRRRRVTA
jgi:hypothetical protein